MAFEGFHSWVHEAVWRRQNGHQSLCPASAVIALCCERPCFCSSTLQLHSKKDFNLYHQEVMKVWIPGRSWPSIHILLLEHIAYSFFPHFEPIWDLTVQNIWAILTGVQVFIRSVQATPVTNWTNCNEFTTYPLILVEFILSKFMPDFYFFIFITMGQQSKHCLSWPEIHIWSTSLSKVRQVLFKCWGNFLDNCQTHQHPLNNYVVT